MGRLSNLDFTFCYNTSKSTSNDMKYTPFEMIFGRSNNMPHQILDGRIDPIYNTDNYVHELKLRLQTAHKEAGEIVNKIKLRNKKNYDRNVNKINFQVGDKIKVINEPYHKHKFIYNGPFNIIAVENENVIIDLNGKIHKNRVLKY